MLKQKQADRANKRLEKMSDEVLKSLADYWVPHLVQTLYALHPMLFKLYRLDSRLIKGNHHSFLSGIAPQAPGPVLPGLESAFLAQDFGWSLRLNPLIVPR